MNPKSAIQKGKDLEEFIVGRLRTSGLDERAYRQRGSGNGLHKGDIWNDLGICFEAKNTRNYPGKKTFQQVEREAMGYQEPVIVWHPPQTALEASKVIINWDYFEKLLLAKRDEAPRVENPDKALKYSLQRLKAGINDVLAKIK